jgi:hypothetical protein
MTSAIFGQIPATVAVEAVEVEMPEVPSTPRICPAEPEPLMHCESSSAQ